MKDEIDRILLDKLGNAEFVKLWWILKLPGLGKQKAAEVFKTDPQRVLDYVKAY